MKKSVFWFVILILAASGVARKSLAENQEVFLAASKYTVKVRSVIEYPFVSDRRGVFTGAGFIVDRKRGWIATNAHVVGRINKSVRVKFKDGGYRPAELIYVDTYLDFAVISIEPKLIPSTATEASPDCETKPALGAALGAFGHPHGLDFTGTRGIVSGTKFRWSRNWIQTDAAINSGNSGGPLIEFETGRVIGINTSSYSKSKSEGISFAIPASDFCPVIDLLRDGSDPNPVVIPAAMSLNHEEEKGINIMRVYERTAVRWDLREGDQLEKLIVTDPSGKSREHVLETPADLITGVRWVKGKSANLALSRDNKTITLPVEIKRWPSLLGQKFVYASGATIGVYELIDDELNNPDRLLMVHDVRESSKAAVASLRHQDLIKSVDGQLIRTPELLAAYLSKKKNKVVTLNVVRQWSDYRQKISHKLIKIEIGEVKQIGRW